MIIDTHSHLQFDAYKDDIEEVVKRTRSAGILTINVGTQYETSRKGVEFAEKYGEGFYAAIGLHPMYAAAEFIKLKHDPSEGTVGLETNFDKEKYKRLTLSGSRSVVAIGEIGLDYYYKPKTNTKLAEFKEKQKQVFLQQLELAQELDLPVILHCRMAHDDIIQILESRITNYELRGVIHCFTGTLEQAKKYVEMGFYLGINGIIFKFNIDEVIKNISLEHLLLETDCPYLTPPQASEKRNEPIFIKHTIQRIAELKGVAFEEVCDKTTKNAKSLFRI